MSPILEKLSQGISSHITKEKMIEAMRQNIPKENLDQLKELL